MNDAMREFCLKYNVTLDDDGLPLREPGRPGAHDCMRCGLPAESAQLTHTYIGGLTSVSYVCEPCFKLSFTDSKEYFRVIREKYGDNP